MPPSTITTSASGGLGAGGSRILINIGEAQYIGVMPTRSAASTCRPTPTAITATAIRTCSDERGTHRRSADWYARDGPALRGSTRWHGPAQAGCLLGPPRSVPCAPLHPGDPRCCCGAPLHARPHGRRFRRDAGSRWRNWCGPTSRAGRSAEPRQPRRGFRRGQPFEPRSLSRSGPERDRRAPEPRDQLHAAGERLATQRRYRADLPLRRRVSVSAEPTGLAGQWSDWFVSAQLGWGDAFLVTNRAVFDALLWTSPTKTSCDFVSQVGRRSSPQAISGSSPTPRRASTMTCTKRSLPPAMSSTQHWFGAKR